MTTAPRLCKRPLAPRTRWIIAAAASAALLQVACAGSIGGSDQYARSSITAPTESSLEDALAKPASLRRGLEDLAAFHATAIVLRRHNDTAGTAALRRFLQRTSSSYLSGLSRPSSGREQPELISLRANLLLAEASVWRELGDRRELRRVRRQLSQRFAAMNDLPVEFPIGVATTLGNALEQLRPSQGRL